jgi:hypothetical protein
VLIHIQHLPSPSTIQTPRLPCPCSAAGVEIELKPASEGEDVEWDPENKVLRLPINVVEASGQSKLAGR